MQAAHHSSLKPYVSCLYSCKYAPSKTLVSNIPREIMQQQIDQDCKEDDWFQGHVCPFGALNLQRINEL